MKKEEVDEIRRIAKQAEEICREIETLEAALPLLDQTYGSFQAILGYRGSGGHLLMTQGEKVLRLGLKAYIDECNEQLSQLHFPGTTAAAKIISATETPEAHLVVIDDPGGKIEDHKPPPFVPSPQPMPTTSIADEVNNRINSDPTLRELIG